MSSHRSGQQSGHRSSHHSNQHSSHRSSHHSGHNSGHNSGRSVPAPPERSGYGSRHSNPSVSHHPSQQSNGRSHRSAAGASANPRSSNYVPGGGASMLPSRPSQAGSGSSRTLGSSGNFSWRDIHQQAMANAGSLPSGPRVKLCECGAGWSPSIEQLRGDRAAYIHTAKHLVNFYPENQEEIELKLFLIQTCKMNGVDCTDVGVSHWGMLGPNPDMHHLGTGIVNMRNWTLAEQIQYFRKEFLPPGDDCMDKFESAMQTFGCLNHRHYGLTIGELLDDEADKQHFKDFLAERKACHQRRTGHQYQGGCCGRGTYFSEGGGEFQSYGDGSSRRSGPSRSVRFDMSGITRSMASGTGSRSRQPSARTGSGRPSQSGGSGGHAQQQSTRSGGHTSGSRTSQANWRPPNARSEHGVPANQVLGGGGRSLHASENTSSILPGESMAAFNERQGRRRDAGQRANQHWSQHQSGQGSRRSWVPKRGER